MSGRVLIVAYEFPPVGGAGVQRIAKWVKYLPTFGWTPTVLTVSDPSVPVSDHSLLKDIPETTRVIRARTLEPGYAAKKSLAVAEGDARPNRLKQTLKTLARTAANQLLQPDPQCLWRPAAVRAGLAELRRERYDAILATAPPFSSLLIGSSLARRSQLPLVVDFRDEWTTCTDHWENRQSNWWTRLVQKRQQDSVLNQASTVVATTWRSTRAISAHANHQSSPAVFACIPNGFDPADFDLVTEPPKTGPLRVSYVGTLWNLTDVGPLVEAVTRLSQRSPDLAENLELVFAGRRTPAQNEKLDRLEKSPCRLIRHDYLNHEDALQIQRDSHVLTVLLSDLPEAPRIMPAKVFESMASRRQILNISPRGEVWETLAGHSLAYSAEPSEVDRIAAHLGDLIESRQLNVPVNQPDLDLNRFDRREQTGQLAELLNQSAGITLKPNERRRAESDSAFHESVMASVSNTDPAVSQLSFQENS